MMPKYLIEKTPEGVLSLSQGDLPLQIIPPNGPGEYRVHAVSDQVVDVTVSTTEAPVNQTPPALSGTGRIGELVTATPGVWLGAVSITGQWMRDGIEIAGAQSLSYTPGPADDLSALSYVETALNSIGPDMAQSAALNVLYVAPSLTGLLDGALEVFDQNSGTQILESAIAFEGNGLVYGTNGAGGASINAATGRVSVPTDQALSGVDLEITAQNSGGARLITVQLTVEEGAGGPQAPTYTATEIDAPTGEATFRFSDINDPLVPLTAEVGRFVTGEAFVLSDPGLGLGGTLPAYGVLDISAYDPDLFAASSARATSYMAAGQRVVNGLVTDPYYDAYGGQSQGWDDYPVNFGDDTYETARNVDPGRTGAALALTHGRVFMKGVSVIGQPDSQANKDAALVCDNGMPVRRVEVLTALDAVPPADAFRPPLKGWDGVTWYTDDDFDYDRLFEAGHPFYPQISTTSPTSPLMNFWVSTNNQFIRGQAIADQTEAYYESYGGYIGTSLISLFGASSAAQKIERARHIIQWAIDGVYGEPHRPDEFYNPGIIGAAALLSYLLVDPAKRAAFDALLPRDPFTEQSYSQEQHRFGYVPASLIDAAPNQPTTAGRERVYAWQSGYEGYPWRKGIKDTPISGDDLGDVNEGISSNYYNIGLDACTKIALAMHAMGTVQPDIWTRTGTTAMRDVYDMVWYFGDEGFDRGTVDVNNIDYINARLASVTQNEYECFRDFVYAQPGYVKWTGIPYVPFPPYETYDADNTRLGVLLHQMVLDAGSPITRIDIRYKINGAAGWTLVADIAIGTKGKSAGDADGTPYYITGINEGDAYEIQIRKWNANGASGWSTNESFDVYDVNDPPALLPPERAKGIAMAPVPPNFRLTEVQTNPPDPNGLLGSGAANLLTGAVADFEQGWTLGAGWEVLPAPDNGFGQVRVEATNAFTTANGVNEVELPLISAVPLAYGEALEIRCEVPFVTSVTRRLRCEVFEWNAASSQLNSTKCYVNLDPTANPGEISDTEDMLAEITNEDTVISAITLDENLASRPPFYTPVDPDCTKVTWRYYKDGGDTRLHIRNPQARKVETVPGTALDPQWVYQNGIDRTDNLFSFDISGAALSAGDAVIIFAMSYNGTTAVPFDAPGVVAQLDGQNMSLVRAGVASTRYAYAIWRATKQPGSDTISFDLPSDVRDMQVSVLRDDPATVQANDSSVVSADSSGSSFELPVLIPPQGALVGYMLGGGSGQSALWSSDDGTPVTEAHDTVHGTGRHHSLAIVRGTSLPLSETIQVTLAESINRGALIGIILSR